MEHNNNASERHNEDFKQRYKVMRGFKESGSAFMELRRIVYNFVRPHDSLDGFTPSECAEINLDLGRNRLLGLIKNFFPFPLRVLLI